MPIVKFLISSLSLEQIIRDIPDIPQVIDYACGARHFLNEYAKQILWLVAARHCGLDPQSPVNEEILKQVQNDGYRFKAYYAGITSIEKEYRLSKMAKVSAFMYGKNEENIIYADELNKNTDLKDGTFSILVANPPYSVDSGTFGKTGTNTVTLFLRRKDENPSLVELYRNRVDCWFEGDFEKNDLFQDSHLLQNYCDKIGVALDDYKCLLSSSDWGEASGEHTGSPLQYKYVIFKEYRKAFEMSAEYKNIQKKKISARNSECLRKDKTEKAYFEYLQAVEKDKLYFYMLAESQENPVIFSEVAC